MSFLVSETGRTLVFDHVQEGGEFWTEDGDRSISIPISFRSEFIAAPSVIISITYLDADSSRNLRYQLEPINITNTGFDIYFHSWMDTRIARLGVEWLAIGPETDPRMFQLD